jgi:uncharacterized membrane protein
VMTSSLSCISGSPATSNTVTMIVNPVLPVSVSIAANPGITIDAGTSVTFTATPTNDGTSPTYQWKVNGTNVGTGLSTFTTTTLSNGDVVTCELTSDLPCTSGNPAISNEVSMTVITNKTLTLKVFLEGPYNSGSGLMNANLSTVIPLSQPFNIAPWNYTGTESVASIPANVVDWVLVDLRDAVTPAAALPSTSIAGWPKAYFLKSDGSVVDLDGSSLPIIVNPTITNSLYAVVRHRNHIAIMSNTGLTDVAGSYTYDFSTAVTQAYGGSNGYKQIQGSSVFGMVAGDINADGNIFATDYTKWVISFGNTSSYLNADINMDGNVFTTDYTKWVTNFGMTNPLSKIIQVSKYTSQVPK